MSSPGQSRFSICTQKPNLHRWAWSQQSPQDSSSTAAKTSAATAQSPQRPSIHATAAGVARVYNGPGTSSYDADQDQTGSPSHSKTQAAPSVSITINGSCVCQSPHRQQAALDQSCELEQQQEQQQSSGLHLNCSVQQQQAAGWYHHGRDEQRGSQLEPFDQSLQQQQQQACQALDHEASLAHLHQQPTAVHGLHRNIQVRTVPPGDPSADGQPDGSCLPAQQMGRVGHLQTGLERAESDATSREATGAAAELEGDAAFSAATSGNSLDAAARQSSREAGASASMAGPADAIDTAALQQEVSQLRQQVLLLKAASSSMAQHSSVYGNMVPRDGMTHTTIQAVQKKESYKQQVLNLSLHVTCTACRSDHCTADTYSVCFLFAQCTAKLVSDCVNFCAMNEQLKTAQLTLLHNNHLT